MKKFIFISVFFMSLVLIRADIHNPLVSKKQVYENGKQTESMYSKDVKFKNKQIRVFVGFDRYKKVSEISVAGNLTDEEFVEIKNVISEQGTCVTDCSRANKCSDKPTSVGSGGCYAECIIDCIF